MKKQVQEMRTMAELLVSYTFPRVRFEEEQNVLVLKQRNFVIEGYHVLVCFSKADYEKYFLESLQIQPVYSPFLPFNVVCNIGQIFLGEEHLSYVEFYKRNKKVYCWTVKLMDEKPIFPGKMTEPGSYEGFEYNIFKDGSVDLH